MSRGGPTACPPCSSVLINFDFYRLGGPEIRMSVNICRTIHDRSRIFERMRWSMSAMSRHALNLMAGILVFIVNVLFQL